MKLARIITKTLIWLAVLWSGHVHATTGLGSLEGLVWLLLVPVVVAVAALVVMAIYVSKYSNKAKPNNLFRVVTIVLLLLGSPVLLVAFTFSSTGFSMGMFACLLIYLALLTVGLLSYIDNRSIVFGFVGVILLAYLVSASQIISFTAYNIVDNQVFTPTHELDEQLGAKFIRTSDKQLYRFTGHQLRGNDWLKNGARMQIVQKRSDSSIFVVSVVGDSNQYYQYSRNRVEPWFTIPLWSFTIEKNASRYIGGFELLSDTAWKATNRNITNALFHGCCNADWVAELIEHGADPTQVAIGSRNALHYLSNEVDGYPGVVETAAVLIRAGVKINQKDEWGATPLYVVIDDIESSHFQHPEKAARFIAFITMLLDAGADPNIANKYNDTPLYQAVSWRRYELAQLLLEYGADPRVVHVNKRSAFEMASYRLKNSTEEDDIQVLSQLIDQMN